MSFKSSVKFAGSLIFPKAEKKSTARASLFGAILCIGLSIVPLIVVLSISNGMIEGMTERIIGLSSSHIQAYVASGIDEVRTAENFTAYAASYKDKYSEIKNVYPELGVTALASGKNYRSGAQIRAMERNIFSENKSFAELFEVLEGSLEDYLSEEASSEKKAVIGQKLAENLNVHAGDSFRIITTKSINGIMAPKLTTFTVSAIVTSGYQELDALWVFIPLETAYSFLSLSNANYTIMMETDNGFGPGLVKLQRQLQTDNGMYANFYRWDQVHESEFENFSSTKVMLVFIMALIVLVSSINVSSAIIMLVMERQKEIAILKSIGAKPSDITWSFLMAGTSCGAAGVLFGLPVGILTAVFSNSLIKGLEEIINWFYKTLLLMKGQSLEASSFIKLLDPAYYIQNFSVSIDAVSILLICGMTILLSLIVSILPAIRAGKEKPLEIMRKV